MRKLVFILLVIVLLPARIQGQERWRAAIAETGLGLGPRGFSVPSGFAVEPGITRRLRVVSRWSQDPGSTLVELGPALRLGAGTRVVEFAGFLLGVQWENKPWSSERTPYASFSASIGLDVRIFPPVTLRFAFRHQEVPGSSRAEWESKNGRNTGVLIGLGLTGG